MLDNQLNGITLVLGGNGKTGRRVVERLRGLGRAVRPGSRSANPAFDWNDRLSWGPALSGVRAAYVSYQPDLAVPGALETLQAFFSQAVHSGVKKLVLLSGRGEVEAVQAEDSLRAFDVDWTILRASWFCQNFSEGYFLDPVLSGEVALPAGTVAEPFVDADDIADVAVAALTQSQHARQLYELTGPRSLSFAEAVAQIAAATGRDIRYVAISPQAYRAALVEAQVPTGVIDVVLYLFGTVLDGRNAMVTDGVQRALGRAPRDFSDYARSTASTGTWSV